MANKYELLYTLPAKYTEEEIAERKNAITAELTKLGLSISRNEEIGKIKLGYPMKHIRHGHYMLVIFESEPTAIAKVNEFLRLHNEILRFQIVAFDPAIKPIVALADPEARREMPEAPIVAAPIVPVTQLTPEELDKKLDALEDDITKAL
jgi:small subunit ribosomal protein S6